MIKYYFVKVTNNRNKKEFDIVITRSKNVKLKMYGLKCLFNLYMTGHDITYRPIFDLLKTDYSWYKYDAKEFTEYNDAKLYRLSLLHHLHDKYTDYTLVSYSFWS